MNTPSADAGIADAYVYHLCPRAVADAIRSTGCYRPESLAREGFVHCSRAHQVRPTARAYFAGVPDLVVLVIDAAQLGDALVYEAPAPLPTATPKPAAAADERYPHCYAPIDARAVVEVVALDQFAGAG